MAEVQTLEGLLHRLVAGEAGPFMVAGGSAHSGQLQIGLRLMQPVSGTIHGAIVAALAGPVAGAADGPDSKPVRVHHAPMVRGKRVCCRSCCRLPPLA